MLTEQEAKVLKLLCEGKTNKDIAQTLGISIHTVKAHITHILQKFNVSNRTIAAYIAGKKDFYPD